MPRWAIVVHGGCGRWRPADTAAALARVRAAVAAAHTILAAGGAALDAVCAAVVVLEDDPLFNAGTGSSLNRDGDAEMDAAVMVGNGLQCGGVAAIRRVRNPVLVARRVMEATEHVLLAGEGAVAFARAHGFRDYDPVTRASRARFRAAAAARGNTVGAVALDARGALAAATSTGGTALKLPGRVGDSPIPGAGNYATQRAAASATGRGELMMRALATKSLCDRVTAGARIQTAANAVIAALPAPPEDSAALIALDHRATVGVAMRGGRMPHAWLVEGARRVVARMR
ncbi:MAG TPA: isoaspartyl peptidase/L-asparaginase [Burkholderiales bacterium]|nr:isoaspartyl peptidase/L-asparaginase [Burkholderiales bacterium]